MPFHSDIAPHAANTPGVLAGALAAAAAVVYAFRRAGRRLTGTGR